MANVHGIMVTKNDWGLLPVSICHALTHHVNILHVLDHGSADQTRAGLKILKGVWGERLRLYRSGPELPFQQALITNILVTVAEKLGAEWVYVVDSDEFLLGNPTVKLQRELETLSASVVAVRYEVRNFITPSNFNRFCLDHYESVKYMANPRAEKILPSPYDAIYSGTATYFDAPFPSKLIFRANTKLWIRAGAHSINWFPSGTREITNPGLMCAHITFAGRDFLLNKVAHGEELIRQGFPKGHGWQSQLLARLARENRLDEFWRRHSIGADSNLKHIHSATEVLSSGLKDSITFLKDLFRSDDLSKELKPVEIIQEKIDEYFDFAMVFDAVQRVADREMVLKRSLSNVLSEF
jgi:hypothetical protein